MARNARDTQLLQQKDMIAQLNEVIKNQNEMITSL